MKSENSSYYLEYDTAKQLTQKDLKEGILSFSTKNDMSDDCPVFSLVIVAKEKWDKKLGSNDLIRISVIPDTRKEEPVNPYVMVGLISSIHKEGEYDDGTLLYRVSGRAMAKALLDFEVGVIQEVSAVIADIGWLPDDKKEGLDFSGNTAAGIGEELMNDFVYEYVNYRFDEGKGLQDYFEHDFYSWEEDEELADITSFINYQGSLRQFLEDIAAKPFNEVFFEFTPEGTCKAMMRPTPFDKDKWNSLFVNRFTSDIVLEESFGKSDEEMYSVYVVQPPNAMDLNSMDLGVFPKFHPDLIDKYGYKRLDAENKYLLSAHLADLSEGDEDEEGDEEEAEEAVFLPSYEPLLQFLHQNELTDKEKIRTERTNVSNAISNKYPDMPQALIDSILDAIKEDIESFTRESYNTMVEEDGGEGAGEVNAEKNASGQKVEKFTNKLFNWYSDNANFYSGDIRILGDPRYRVGTRAQYEDFEQDTFWDFYVEAVSHEFSFTNGYSTTLGVTRGLPDSGAMRFGNLWGKAEDFKGGYLGELSMEDLLEKSKEAKSTTDTGSSGIEMSWGGVQGGATAMSALETAQRMTKSESIYDFGGGRTQLTPFQSSPVRVDCSSFVWWCFYENGVSLKGGKTGMNTDSIKTDSRLKTISSRGSSKTAAMDKVRKGDLVYFDTYKADGHMGFYAGDGKFIGAQSSSGISSRDMKSGYWWDKFSGHVLRY